MTVSPGREPLLETLTREINSDTPLHEGSDEEEDEEEEGLEHELVEEEVVGLEGQVYEGVDQSHLHLIPQVGVQQPDGSVQMVPQYIISDEATGAMELVPPDSLGEVVIIQDSAMLLDGGEVEIHPSQYANGALLLDQQHLPEVIMEDQDTPTRLIPSGTVPWLPEGPAEAEHPPEAAQAEETAAEETPTEMVTEILEGIIDTVTGETRPLPPPPPPPKAKEKSPEESPPQEETPTRVLRTRAKVLKHTTSFRTSRVFLSI